MSKSGYSLLQKFRGLSIDNNMDEAEACLRAEKKVRLKVENIKRPSTKWELRRYSDVNVKVVLARDPLVGTGPLPDWLHNRAMVALEPTGTTCVSGAVLLFITVQGQIEAHKQNVC